MKLSTIQQQLAILSSALAEEHTRNKRKDEETAKLRAQELSGLEEKLAEVARELHTKKTELCFRCKSNIPEENLKGASPAKGPRQSMS